MIKIDKNGRYTVNWPPVGRNLYKVNAMMGLSSAISIL